MSVDSKGNLYVGEASTGRRVQRFLLQGSNRLRRICRLNPRRHIHSFPHDQGLID